MIANVVHSSLNDRGGSERLAIITMHALSSMGIDIELTLFEKPYLLQLEKAYGKSTTSVLKKIRAVNIVRSFKKPDAKKYYDLTINTHGDWLPYFQPTFSKSNTIVYCHFPLAKYLIKSKDPEYSIFLNTIDFPTKSTDVLRSSQKHLQSASSAYNNMLRNSTIVTNSEYSRKAIWKTFSADSTVLSPPVAVDIFRKGILSSNNRKDIILVIARFHPTKKIENAIRLAKLLKEREIGSGIKIVGNIPPGRPGYYFYLKQMVDDYNLTDYVKFEINVGFSKLLKLMRESKVYLHPLVGEPFGISTVEAMSSGLIPVVPDFGGHTEFVPSKYQFHTFGEGVEAISIALKAPNSERILISDSVKKYSTQNFIRRFRQIVSSLISNKIKP